MPNTKQKPKENLHVECMSEWAPIGHNGKKLLIKSVLSEERDSKGRIRYLLQLKNGTNCWVEEDKVCYTPAAVKWVRTLMKAGENVGHRADFSRFQYTEVVSVHWKPGIQDYVFVVRRKYQTKAENLDVVYRNDIKHLGFYHEFSKKRRRRNAPPRLKVDGWVNSQPKKKGGGKRKRQSEQQKQRYKKRRKGRIVQQKGPKYGYHGITFTGGRYRGALSMSPTSSTTKKTTPFVFSAKKAAIEREHIIRQMKLEKYNRVNFLDKACTKVVKELQHLHKKERPHMPKPRPR